MKIGQGETSTNAVAFLKKCVKVLLPSRKAKAFKKIFQEEKMAIFGEKYSREGFEEAVKDRDEHAQEHAKVLDDLTPDTPPAEWPHSGQVVRKDATRVENLYSAGQKEAMELNKEHLRLQKTVEDAQKELYKFEKNKLGMHRETQEDTE